MDETAGVVTEVFLFRHAAQADRQAEQLSAAAGPALDRDRVTEKEAAAIYLLILLLWPRPSCLIEAGWRGTLC